MFFIITDIMIDGEVMEMTDMVDMILGMVTVMTEEGVTDVTVPIVTLIS